MPVPMRIFALIEGPPAADGRERARVLTFPENLPAGNNSRTPHRNKRGGAPLPPGPRAGPPPGSAFSLRRRSRPRSRRLYNGGGPSRVVV
ncbi:hypothetical protein EVAR_81717_1 [Eumeta japonica]|uniref:Uncharacterized protein n=1 Tax=Eumeta variegata TaxID=151549 RepID=A0A4C1UHE7_EUMVA|nr:hypothetical protein EVAR_81717_1 [Eumeta japonica]